MFNDIQGLMTHFNGLEEIIRRRGGLQALSLNPVIRMVLFWYDIESLRSKPVCALIEIEFVTGSMSIPHLFMTEVLDSHLRTIFCLGSACNLCCHFLAQRSCKPA
jgi:hypothetical protein